MPSAASAVSPQRCTSECAWRCWHVAPRRRRPPAKGAAPFRVALLTPGPITDQAWNGGAYQGLLRIRDSLGAQISHIQTKSPADFEENFRQYGAQGYDLVFGHGFEFQDAASRVSADFPKTIFITTSGNAVRANVAPMVFGFEEPSYLAGILAAHLSKSGMIGAIGGTELPPVRSSFLAFEAGVHAVKPKREGPHLVRRQLGGREHREGAGDRADPPRRRCHLPERRCGRARHLPGGARVEGRLRLRRERGPERRRPRCHHRERRDRPAARLPARRAIGEGRHLPRRRSCASGRSRRSWSWC